MVEIVLMATAAVMAVLLHVADAADGHQSALAGWVYRLANRFGGTPDAARENLRVLFFCCFLVMFWGSELVIHRWRRAMYAALDPLDDRRAALEQGTG